MNEQLKNHIEEYKKTDWPALLREDMGKYHLKELKPHLDFIKNLMDSIIYSPHLDLLLKSQNYQNLLQSLLQELQRNKELIINNKDATQNQQITNSILWLRIYIMENFQPLFNALKIHEAHKPEKPLAAGGDQTQSTKTLDIEVKKYADARKKLEEESKKVLSQLKEQIVKAEASRYGDFFKNEAKKNKRLSWAFGAVFLVSSAAACVFAYKFLRFDQGIAAESFAELLIKGDMINKIFIFSVILFAVSVIKREYMALRHQFTLNTHRHNALSSHKEILSSIKKTANESDREISNAVLLELTKSMFSPQDTGFVKDQAAGSSGSRTVEISKTLFSSGAKE